MPDNEQGPLDPAFAKFREQRVVERLAEKLNAPAAPPREKPAAAAAAHEALPDRAKVQEIAQENPELGKFLEKKLNEAEADDMAGDGARLVFGAALRGSAAEDAPGGAATQGSSGGEVEVAPSHLSRAGDAIRPAAKVVAASKSAASPSVAKGFGSLVESKSGPSPVTPRAAPSEPAPKPSAGAPPPRSAEKPPATRAAAEKPAATKAAAEKPPRPAPRPAVESEPAVELEPVALPARPEAPGEKEDLAGQLLAIGGRLSAILGESSHRLLELKVAASDGMDRAITNLEAEARRAREYLERNEALAGEAEVAARAADEQVDIQDDLEGRVAALWQRAGQVGNRVEALRAAKEELEALAASLEQRVDDSSSAADRARSTVDRLDERLVGATSEIEELERVRARLAESVERLEGLKKSSEGAIVRLKGMKDALTKPTS